MEKTDQVLSEAISKVASSLESMVADYGADTVELALTAVRLGALSGVILSALLLVLLVPAGLYTVKMVRYGWREGAEGLVVLGGGLSAVISLFTFMAVAKLANPATWAAVFGYPEVYLAYKALVSVGLLRQEKNLQQHTKTAQTAGTEVVLQSGVTAPTVSLRVGGNAIGVTRNKRNLQWT